MKKPPSKVAHNRPPTFFFNTGPAAQTAQKQKSLIPKSPLMQDWVFRLGGQHCFKKWFLFQVEMETRDRSNRVRPRFFDLAWHETMYASSGNKYFFTISCHCQTYQNYEQPPRTSQNSYFQSFFCVKNWLNLFKKKFPCGIFD